MLFNGRIVYTIALREESVAITFPVVLLRCTQGVLQGAL
jgi:hypothetical protein